MKLLISKYRINGERKILLFFYIKILEKVRDNDRADYFNLTVKFSVCIIFAISLEKLNK